MIDIHSHILFDIEGDDGSRSQEMTLEMLKMAVASGTEQMIATPHINRSNIVPEWESIQERVEQVNALAQENNLPIRIHAGGEVQLDYEMMAQLDGKSTRYCLADSNYILIELTSQSEPAAVEQMLFELMLRGYRPILAHPERYDRLIHHPEIILDWMHKGVLTQCNTGSFHGYFGERVQKRVEMIHRHQMITFLGSDAHRVEVRTPDTQKAQEALKTLTGSEAFWTACRDNAQHILNNTMVYPDLPSEFKKAKKTKSFFARLFG